MFEFPLEPATVFAERALQFAGWGIPEPVISRVRASVDDMWGDGPSSWVPVWRAEALAAEAGEQWLTAALCWGAARFPCLAGPARVQAYERQLACYPKAAAFERWVCEVPYRSGTTPVPVHLYRGDSRSLLVMSGGVDTWKVEVHRTALAAARGMTVAVLDMPGTGESEVPLAADADVILAGAVERIAGHVGAGRTAFVGLSFGGHWAAKLALTGRVHAAVDIGGPVGAAGHTVDLSTLPNGMPGIVGHALGLAALPTADDADRFAADFSLRRQGLLDDPLPVPLLAVNGTADPYLPAEDTAVFHGDPNATAWLVPGAGHCASEHLATLLPAALAWLRFQLERDPRSAADLIRARHTIDPLLAGSPG
ncbi:alpha/beta hydrolase [Nonomuraea sp. K274]|uniref:Alpha/beta hydrolase n=1 Tax=Nonomuraea cypriaca TaxID=1187855 RepID=A0A931A2H6_9ACTN|nr:alpha/beta hydrolase [Nonomuraea cypriaca]MBF8185021.1 alpha/beta hydrolase [Nonomuraea cypriaca]